MVFLTDPASIAEDRKKVRELLREHEGIASILEPSDFPVLGLPDPAKNPQMGDLLLVAREGYAFSNEAFDDNSITELTSPSGSHGYLADNPKMNGMFVAWGRGIRQGAKLGVIDNRDIAPTIAALLDQSFPGCDGKVLRQILSHSAP